MKLTEIAGNLPYLSCGTFVTNLLNGTILTGYPVRVVFDSFTRDASHGPRLASYYVSIIQGGGLYPSPNWKFRRRTIIRDDKFVVVHIIPTGIGCEIGGHAGDGGPTAILLGSVCDTLISHPNVVNASDINEMPSNMLYVEGSTLTRLLLGNISLQPRRSNRVLVIISNHEDRDIVDWSYNAICAACSSYGLTAEILVTDNSINLWAGKKNERAVGGAELDEVYNILTNRKDTYDAVAVTCPIVLPDWKKSALDYFKHGGVNPWGGVEAMFTHALSMMFSVPVAHSPMDNCKHHAQEEVGIVDKRMAAEVVSTTYLNSILKGLMRSPSIHSVGEGSIEVEDVNCLVIPRGCLGIPVLAALDQGIMVIEVMDNENIMTIDLDILPWAKDQHIRVTSYLEAVGVLACLREGMNPESVIRTKEE